MKLVIKNINKLVQTEETTRKWVAGSDMKTINFLEDAFIEIENGLISNFGTMDQCKFETYKNVMIFFVTSYFRDFVIKIFPFSY